MKTNREQAKVLMKHYFGLLAEKAGLRVDSDNEAELDDLVDCLIDAAKEELEKEQKEG